MIQQAFATLFNKVNTQQRLIAELETKQKNFVQHQHFTAALASKVSLQEHALKFSKVYLLVSGTKPLTTSHFIIQFAP